MAMTSWQLLHEHMVDQSSSFHIFRWTKKSDMEGLHATSKSNQTHWRNTDWTPQLYNTVKSRLFHHDMHIKAFLPVLASPTFHSAILAPPLPNTYASNDRDPTPRDLSADTALQADDIAIRERQGGAAPLKAQPAEPQELAWAKAQPRPPPPPPVAGTPGMWMVGVWARCSWEQRGGTQRGGGRCQWSAEGAGGSRPSFYG